MTESGGTGRDRPPTHRTVNGRPGLDAHPQPRHIWVTVTGITHDKHVGVLLDWRRGVDGWEALVFWATGGGRHTAHSRIEWLPAHHVEPTGGGAGG